MHAALPGPGRLLHPPEPECCSCQTDTSMHTQTRTLCQHTHLSIGSGPGHSMPIVVEEHPLVLRYKWATHRLRRSKNCVCMQGSMRRGSGHALGIGPTNVHGATNLQDLCDALPFLTPPPFHPTRCPCEHHTPWHGTCMTSPASSHHPTLTGPPPSHPILNPS